LKKRNKKLLLGLSRAHAAERGPNKQKFFASFFQKRSPSFLHAVCAGTTATASPANNPAFTKLCASA
jgi:hypothetical protein